MNNYEITKNQAIEDYLMNRIHFKNCQLVSCGLVKNVFI